MQFYGIVFMQSGRWQIVLDLVCLSLPEDEHFDVRNMLKSL